MWFHLRMALHLVRVYWLGLGIRTVAAGMVALCTLLCWWVGVSVVHDVDRQREALIVDVVMNADFSADSAVGFVSSLVRRPDVLSAQLLDSTAVWLAFQKELGVNTTGLVELAALPNIVQVRLRSQYASAQYVKRFKDAILRSNLFAVDRVLIPETAYTRLESRRHDSNIALVSGMSFLLIAAFGVFWWQFRSLSCRSLWAIARSHGRGWWWSNGGTLITSVLASVIAATFAVAALLILSANLRVQLDWLIPLRNMLSFPGWS